MNQGSEGRVLRKPSWIRVKSPVTPAYKETVEIVRKHKLHTVCEEAACPNIAECWNKGHITVMILGSVCTRACAFCNVKTGIPQPVDDGEPARVAEIAVKTGAKHVVITSVDRDDLVDGGAFQFVRCIQEIRRRSSATVEILTPDFRGKKGSLEQIVPEKPDVYNHNIETVPSLYQGVRPGARYYHSIRLLDDVKRCDPSIFTKSGIMVGLGERKAEVLQVMDDMRSAGVDFLTIGQYLRPSKRHIEVAEYVTPEVFKYYEKIAYSKGFLMVSSSPLTRSSYHADDDFVRLRDARLKGLQL